MAAGQDPLVRPVGRHRPQGEPADPVGIERDAATVRGERRSPVREGGVVDEVATMRSVGIHDPDLPVVVLEEQTVDDPPAVG